MIYHEVLFAPACTVPITIHCYECNYDVAFFSVSIPNLLN